MFIAYREPQAAWLEALASVAPMREQASHLTIRWHGGTPDVPTGRWVIFECLPADVAHVYGQYEQLFSDEVDGADPMIQWARDYYDRTRTIPCPVWVVQGDGGGHPYQYTTVETVLAKAGLLPPELPPVGDLPYAEPDVRTWKALAQRSLLNRKVVDQMAARELAREAAERIKRARELQSNVEALSDDVRAGLSDILETAAPVLREDARGTAAQIDDEHFDRYIETGQLTLTP